MAPAAVACAPRAPDYRPGAHAFPLFGESVPGIAREADYDLRIERLVGEGIALWDVIGDCRHKGSLDADIDPGSMQTNDIVGLLKSLPSIRPVAFNGALAENVLRQRIGWSAPSLRWPR